jgi:hypothetical protein
MALAEGAARGILARQAHIQPFIEQRAEGQRLAGGPIETFAGFEHLGLGFQLAGDGLVQVEALRHRDQRLATLRNSSSPTLVSPRRSLFLGAVSKPCQRPSTSRRDWAGAISKREFLVQPFVEVRHHGIGISLRERALLHQLAGIELQGRG